LPVYRVRTGKDYRKKMIKCPRCKLPQEEGRKCRYCGYDLTGAKKKHIKIKTTRKRAKKIIGRLKKLPDGFQNKRK
jgi:hypothetical protein